MPIPSLFTSPKVSVDLTKFGPSHWNTVTALLRGLFDGADADGKILTRSAASALGATWNAAPDVAGGIAAALATWLAPAAQGGTGLTSYAVGDLLYASGATALSKRAAVVAGSVLVSAGVGVAPAWSASPTLTSLGVTGGVLGAGPAGFLTIAPAGAAVLRITGGTDATNQLWITTNTFTLGSAGTLLRQRFTASSGNVPVILEALSAGATVTGASVTLESIVTGSLFLSVPVGGKFVIGSPVAPPASANPTLLEFAQSLTTALFSRHTLEDRTSLQGSGNGSSHATFDSKTQITAASAVNYDHMAGFQARMEMRGSGTLSNFYGFMSEPLLLGGTTTNVMAFQVRDPAAGAGALTNNYGLYVQPLVRGTALNYAIFTEGAGLVKISDTTDAGAGTGSIVTLGGIAAAKAINAASYKVGNVAGASKAAGPVTSITVVNGIVTACS